MAAMRRIARWVYDRFATSPDGARHYYEELRKVDAAFDAKTGMDTSGILDLYTLTIAGGNRGFGNAYMATDPDEFAAALALLDMPLENATFIDLGSGKGRALLLAARYRFKRIIGVEFAEELHLAATANVARLQGEERIETMLADASEYTLPAGPVLLYLFNPFDRPLMSAVARKALASWRMNPRPMRVIYGKPFLADCWSGAGWQVLIDDPRFVIFSPPSA
jgi:SAM-dependent methyltransferase